MVFQPDGFYNSPAISSSIKLRRCLYVHYNVHMVPLSITSNKPITLFKPYQRSPGSPRCVFGGGGGCLQVGPAGTRWELGAELLPQILSIAMEMAVSVGST